MEDLSPLEGNVQVVCRFRPFNSAELRLKSPSLISISPDQRSVTVAAPHAPAFTCSLDRVFPENTCQEVVYEVIGEPLIGAVFEGFNGTILTYGQTGSGKTYTMTGTLDDSSLKGVIPRMVSSVFDRIEAASEALEFTLKVSYCEIYMERIKDLLDPTKSNLKVHEDRTRGVFISNLSEQYVTNEDEVYELMRLGTANREVAATLMNEGSSRSHSIFLLTLSQSNTLDFSARNSKLYLVDLAGSEKVGKTGAEGKRLDEAKLINKSLSTLGLVIYSLTDPKATHVPYRDSKLTRVLQDSLGGNAKTALITTCSPAAFNVEETLSTLRFGVRAKSVRNQPKVNKEPTLAELKMLLMKAETEAARKDKRIEALERLLQDNGVDPESTGGRVQTQEEPEGEDRDLALHPAIERLESQLEDLQTRLSEELSSSAALRQEIKDSHERTLMAEHEFIKQSSLLMDLRVEMMRLKEDLLEKDDAIQQLTVANVSLDGEFARVMGEKKDLEGKLENMQEEAERTASENSRNSRVGSFLRAHPRLTEELELKDAQIREISARLEAREALIAQIRDKTNDKAIGLLIRNCEKDRGEALENTKEMLKKAYQEVTKLREELAKSKAEGDKLLRGKVPGLEELKRTIYAEAVDSARREWEEEKAQMGLDLQNRVEKVIRLEIEIDEAHESYRSLEESVRGGDSAMAHKVTGLEKALDALNLNYHTLLSQGSHLRVENEVLSKRVSRKSDRIKVLECELATARDQLKQAAAQLEALSAELLEARTRGLSSRSAMSFTCPRLKRPLKGGAKETATVLQETRDALET